MARLAVLASGAGTNFEALANAVALSRHELALLVSDRKGAFALERAKRLGVKFLYVPYSGREREEAESEISRALETEKVDIVALAGFMRLLGSAFVRHWSGRLVNVHPSLLPGYPGKDSIERAFDAGEPMLGVTIHYVDEGMDTGPIIAQERIARVASGELPDMEAAIHELEYMLYPKTVLALLDEAEGS